MNRARLLVNVEAAHKSGIFGKGIGIAVLDSGVSAHPDFKDRISCFKDFVGGRQSLYDDCGHGTHISGIICGDGRMSAGKYIGIAPASHIINAKVLDKKGNGNRYDVIKGINWVIQNKDLYSIRILNISVGTEKEGNEADFQLVAAVEKAWDAGLVVVVAAGNMGPEPMSITAPGNSRKVITVGSSDESMKSENIRSGRLYYSGRGPTRECVCKPEVVAPGSDIVSCNAVDISKKGFYCAKSGTSMATPIVSGGIALLLSKYPDLSNVEVKMKLRETSSDIGFSRYQQGWGRLDIEKLLQ